MSTDGEPASGSIRLAGVAHEWPGSRGGPSVVSLERVDLEVDAGTVVALVGPSGCGKSTLLRIIAGLTDPAVGTVSIDRLDVTGQPGASAWMPQHHNLLPWRRVLANAVLGAEVGGSTRVDAEARARPLLERFGLGGYERAWPSQLSGGMRQRLAVLRTVLIKAPVLLLDEPFGALDALTRRGMHGWFQEVLAADSSEWLPGGVVGGRTVVLVTHDVEEALLLADRVLVMSPRPGRIVSDVTVAFDRPRTAEMVSDPEFVAMRASLLAALGA